VLLAPLRGQQLRVIDLIVDGRGEESRSQGDESGSYVVPDDATTNILLLIQMHFGLVLKH